MPTKLIRLTQGLFALVDAEDYVRINAVKWCAWASGSAFYAARKTGTRKTHLTVYMHRVVLDAPEGLSVDHINGDRLDNRRSNLRICSHRENLRNRSGNKVASSPYCGVSFDRERNKWDARIKADRRTHHLGRFADPEAAARAYDAAALRLHGEFARLNFPLT